MTRQRIVLALGVLGLLGACSTADNPLDTPLPSTPALREEYEPVGDVPASGGITQITFYDATNYSLRRTLGPDADEVLSIETGTYALDLNAKTLTLTPANGTPVTAPITIKSTASQGGLQLQTVRPNGLLGTIVLILEFIFENQTFETDAPVQTSSTDDAGWSDPDVSVVPDASPVTDSGGACVPTPEVTDAATTPTTGDGVDVSHYQPNIDWTTVHQSKAFAYTKATEGTKYTDSSFAKNYQAMKAVGMSRGAYHFFRASKDPVAQADYFVNALVAHGFDGRTDLAPMLDVEVTDGVAPSTVVSGIGAFLQEAQKKLGVTLIIYTGPSFWTHTLGNPDFSENPLWIAHYTSAPKPKVPSHWSNYTIWQFTEQGSVPGINGNVDSDRTSGFLPPPPVADASTQDANVGCTLDGGDAGSLIPGNCTHDVCTAGERLGQACDSCTMVICANDPYCCDTLWGPSCFPDVEKYCGKKCP
jgi:lysozyme